VREPARILIVRLSHLGDVVCSLGILHALHAAYPRAEIAWAVQSEFAELVEGMPGCARVIRFDRRGGLAGLLRTRRELRAFAPELAVDAQGNLKSALLAFLSGARRRTGFARGDWREKLGAVVLHDSAPYSGAAHAVDRLRALAAHVAPATASDPLRTDPALTPEELRAGTEHLHTLLPGAEHPVLCHLSDPGDVRGWPLERWLALGRAARAAGRPVLILAGPAEQAIDRALRERLPAAPGLAYWSGAKPLRLMASIFAAAAGNGGRLVACDSGPMHLAWASGLAVTVLEGPTSALRTGPWPVGCAPHVELRSATQPPCAPCFARRCSLPEGPVCMGEITADDVLPTLAGD